MNSRKERMNSRKERMNSNVEFKLPKRFFHFSTIKPKLSLKSHIPTQI